MTNGHRKLPKLRTGLIGLLLITTACTQSPTRVDMKGHQIFGRNGVSEVQDTGVYRLSTPQQHQMAKQHIASNQKMHRAAKVVHIASRDLSPVSAGASGDETLLATNKIAQKNKSDSVALAHANSKNPQPVNLWTKEPHFADKSSNITLVKPKPITSVYANKTTPSVSFMWPVTSRKVLSEYGPKGGGRVNDGLVISSQEGEPVWAAANGEVVFVGDELKGYGNMILIKHEDGRATTYAHLNRASVDKYERVKQGDIIGYVGSTGNVRSPQLYFALNENGKMVNPKRHLGRKVAKLR